MENVTSIFYGIGSLTCLCIVKTFFDYLFKCKNSCSRDKLIYDSRLFTKFYLMRVILCFRRFKVEDVPLETDEACEAWLHKVFREKVSNLLSRLLWNL